MDKLKLLSYAKVIEKFVAWGQRKMKEDTISEKESKRILREIEKMMEENKVI